MKCSCLLLHYRFVADGEIGSKAVTELLYVNVSDASRNLLPSQMLSVLITPVDSQPPVVTVGPDVQVGVTVRVPVGFTVHHQCLMTIIISRLL